jgi:pimeloyl-ACP methyl ester carboxylesterase
LTGSYHVYGVTRRGHGASSQPASGYDDQRLADDVLQVLDALHIALPVLVGHSMAGGELTTLGNQHSDRLSALVYLDALADPRDEPGSDPAWIELQRKLPPIAPPAPPSADASKSFSGYREWEMRSQGWSFPESEWRNIMETNPDGTRGRFKSPRRIGQAIGEGQKKRDYSAIRVPVMAFFEFPRSSKDLGARRPGDPRPRNAEERAAIGAFADATKVFMDRWTKNLQSGVPNARLVDLPGAGHYVFLTRESEVVQGIREFIASLP